MAYRRRRRTPSPPPSSTVDELNSGKLQGALNRIAFDFSQRAGENAVGNVAIAGATITLDQRERRTLSPVTVQAGEPMTVQGDEGR